MYPRAVLALTLLALTPALACQKVIGDSCSISTDCSIEGDRTCDISQPCGYCTITACDPNTCPDNNSVCVNFDANASRLARTYCMSGCSHDSDCRSNYHCAFPDAPTCISNPAASCNLIIDTTPIAPGWCVQVGP